MAALALELHPPASRFISRRPYELERSLDASGRGHPAIRAAAPLMPAITEKKLVLAPAGARDAIEGSGG
jgi:hypothetical protein